MIILSSLEPAKLHKMEKKIYSHLILQSFFFILFLMIFSMNMTSMGQKLPIQMRVGVVLHMDNQVVQLGLNRFSMDLSDYYAKHDHYRTRLALNNRDFKETYVEAVGNFQLVNRQPPCHKVNLDGRAKQGVGYCTTSNLIFSKLNHTNHLIALSSHTIIDRDGNNQWVFLKPLTLGLWVRSVCLFVFIGFLILILEHRIKDQLRLVYWFAFSKFFFAQKERVPSNFFRLVLIILFFVVLVLTQNYTATLTSKLTVQHSQPTFTDINSLLRNKEYVGYQQGSYVFDMLKGMNFDESRIKAYSSMEELDELLSKGSRNGGISAAFDSIPYFELFIAKYNSKYIIVDPPMYKIDGLGFVLPIGSPLVTDTSGEKTVEIERKCFGKKSKCPDFESASISSNSLGLKDFWMLVLIIGMKTAIALIIYLIRFLYKNWDVIGHSVSLRDMISGLHQKFHGENPNARDPRNIVDDRERAVGNVEPPENFQQRTMNPQEEVPQVNNQKTDPANPNQNLPQSS